MSEPPDDEPPVAGEPPSAKPASRSHPNDPLHGITLKQIVERLQAHYGWAELGRRIPIRCFTHEPSLGSSLAFLRRTPWARQEVEALFKWLEASRKESSLR